MDNKGIFLAEAATKKCNDSPAGIQQLYYATLAKAQIFFAVAAKYLTLVNALFFFWLNVLCLSGCKKTCFWEKFNLPQKSLNYPPEKSFECVNRF